MYLPFLNVMLLPKPPSTTHLMPYPQSCYSTQHCFWLTSHPEKWDSEPMIMKITGLTCCPYSEAAVLKERWNGFLKTQLQCQFSGSILEGWGRVLQMVVYALSHCPIYSMVSPVARFTGPGLKRWMIPHTIIPSDLLWRFLVIYPFAYFLLV